MKPLTRLFVEQLTVIDCALLDPQRGLVGESFIVDLELEGELDPQSMVLDFSEIKRKLKRMIDQIADHKLLVPRRHAGLWQQESGQVLAISFRGPSDGPVVHESPAEAVCLVDAPRVDAASLAQRLLPALHKEMPANVSAIELVLRHEAIEGAWYRYAHGLKKHLGHCQRIAHGHRSRLQIVVDGARDAALEQRWADRWRDVYLGTQEDVVVCNTERTRFEYSSTEGSYALELPSGRCELMDGDTTVERLAGHIARSLAQERPGQRIEVRAYEGVHKGAIAAAGG